MWDAGWYDYRVDFGAETDQEGNLTAINIGTHRVPVEDCGEDNGGSNVSGAVLD